MQITFSALVVLHAKYIKMDEEKILQAMDKQEKQKKTHFLLNMFLV